MLASGELRCIGSTTFQEYRGIFEKDRALARRFQKIDVVEPTVAESVEILRGLALALRGAPHVIYTNEALQAAVDLSVKHIPDRLLPDKAIDVIDEAGARQRLLPEDERTGKIDVAEVEYIVAKMARIPAKQVSASDRDVLRNLERNLKMVVFGQDPAIEALAASIKMARSGLADPSKPIGCFLLAGPTGVGKTEVTKQLAMQLGIEMIRFDMSEYMEAHSVSRLVGAPPGYVGFDQGGLLTEAVTKHPHAVLLLDEIEKAHPDVFNILLQVMDRGVLTDTNGREANFKNVIVVMTTNAGAAAGVAAQHGLRRAEARFGRDGGDPPQLHAGVPQPAGCDHPVQLAGLRAHPARGRQVPDRAGNPAERKARQPGRDPPRPGAGWPSTASTRRWARGRWPG